MVTEAGLATQWPGPAEVVRQLAATGSREPGTSGHREAQEVLLQAMTASGLDGVRRLPPVGPQSFGHLSGILPGRFAGEWILSAHYDTVAESRGVLDNGSGCGVIIGTASELSRVPRNHTVRLLLTDGEESEAVGTEQWLADLTSQMRRDLLGNLNVDMVGRRDGAGPGVLHIVGGWAADRKVISPAWLVHAVLRGAQATEFPIKVQDDRWSWLAQLSARCTLPTRFSDGRRFLEAGVPSVTLSDLSLTESGGPHPGLEEDLAVLEEARLRGWTRLIAATARRLDQLEGRPRDEREYLVVADRVWIRRDLLWGGFILWMLLVWRGLPGAWRRQSAEDRQRSGRSYLPAFAFRMLFLVSVFLIPTFATVLLYPVALLSLPGRARRLGMQQAVCALASLPSLVFAIWLTAGQVAGWFVLDRSAILPAALVMLTLATFCAWQIDLRSRATGAARAD